MPERIINISLSCRKNIAEIVLKALNNDIPLGYLNIYTNGKVVHPGSLVCSRDFVNAIDLFKGTNLDSIAESNHLLVLMSWVACQVAVTESGEVIIIR